MPLTPSLAYRRLNRLLWRNRLPKAKIVLVDNSILPTCYGMTLHDDDFVAPVIFLNLSGKNHWQKTLVHECLHIAEPALHHGVIFEALVETYWRNAKKNLKGLK